MFNVVREVSDAGQTLPELAEPASKRPPTVVDLALLAALIAEPFDAGAVMERLVRNADND